MTDLWFRNADRAMAVCAQEGVSRLTWTRQHIGRLKIDGITYVRQFYMHTAVRPKIMIIGIQGSSEYDIFSKLTEPKAVYPTWSGKNDSWDDLQRLIDNPWGEDKARCENLALSPGIRPIYGQKHRIVIHNNPSSQSGVARRFFLSLAQVQEDNPGVELFLNGPGSYATLFGLKFRACDFGLSDLGDKNSIAKLPNGAAITFEFDPRKHAKILQDLATHYDWISLLGLTPRDILLDQNKRFAFRIRSARWAAKYWERNLRFFRDGYNIAPDSAAPDSEFEPLETRRIILRPKQFTLAEADKILCNRCRIQTGCRFYRADSICGVVGSEMNDLEKYFDSRNAGRIVDGLAQIVKMQARRVENLIEQESHGTEVSADVDRQLNALFANGVKLAKLVDPNLAGPGTKVQVNVGAGSAAQIVATANPKQVMANIVDALEMQGVPRDKITPEMVAGILKNMSVNSDTHAIEAAAVTFKDLMGEPLSPPVAHPIMMDKQEWDKQNQQNQIEGELVPVKVTGRD